MKRRRTRPAGGFTLIEIMMAMGIFALAMTAIYATWSLILKASRGGLEVAAQAQRERIAVNTVEQALTAARSFQADLAYYGFVIENGSSPGLSFVARLPASFPRSGRFGDFDVRRVTFSLDRGQEFGRDFVLRQSPILMDMDEDELSHPVVLAKNVRAFIVECWDGRKGEWTDEWLETNQLPKLVRFTLKLGGSELRTARIQTEVTRIVALPSIMVPPSWQIGGKPQ